MIEPLKKLACEIVEGYFKRTEEENTLYNKIEYVEFILMQADKAEKYLKKSPISGIAHKKTILKAMEYESYGKDSILALEFLVKDGTLMKLVDVSKREDLSGGIDDIYYALKRKSISWEIK